MMTHRNSRIMLTSVETEPSKPTWLSTFVFDGLMTWYKEHIAIFEVAPDVTDMLTMYAELLIEEYIEQEMNLEDEGIDNAYEYAREKIYKSPLMGVDVFEDLISDLLLITGLAFEVDPHSDGFIIDTDLITCGTDGKLTLGPQLSLFKILEATGEAYVRSGMIHNQANYIRERSVMKREYHNLY